MDGRRPADYGSGLRTTLCGRNHLHLLRSVATGLRLLRTLGLGKMPRHATTRLCAVSMWDGMRRATACLQRPNGCWTTSRAKAPAQASRSCRGGSHPRPSAAGIPTVNCHASPLLPETPRDDALTLILRLRAEAAFRLGRCEEVRTIAARLGHRYKHLENLLKPIDR